MKIRVELELTDAFHLCQSMRGAGLVPDKPESQQAVNTKATYMKINRAAWEAAINNDSSN
jgi:hypothetical protein